MLKPLTITEVADDYGIPLGTLRHWRTVGYGGPQSFKLGRRVVYLREDVESWIASQREMAGVR